MSVPGGRSRSGVQPRALGAGHAVHGPRAAVDREVAALRRMPVARRVDGKSQRAHVCRQPIQHGNRPRCRRATSSAPPAQKSFCTSTTSSAGLSILVHRCYRVHISMSLPVPSALATDLYQLTMMAGYEAVGHAVTSTFELSVRELPASRRYLMAAGLAQALDYSRRPALHPDEIAWLRTVPALAAAPAQVLRRGAAGISFHGRGLGVDEGEIVFAHEPFVRVTAPVMEAQTRRDGAARDPHLPDVGRQQGLARRLGGGGPDGDRIRIAPCARPGSPRGSRRARRASPGCAATSNVEAARRSICRSPGRWRTRG